MSQVNVFLTLNQREWLTNTYLNKLSRIDESIVDDAYDALIHMQNPVFYAECQEFMPTCMKDMSDAGIR